MLESLYLSADGSIFRVVKPQNTDLPIQSREAKKEAPQ